MTRAARLRLLLLVAFLLSTAACSDGEPEPVVELGTPNGQVADWLAALDALDLGGLADTTDPLRVALIAGAENELSNEQLYAVIDSGLPGPTAQSYWASFRSSFETFLGTDIGSIEVGEVNRFSIEDSDFAAVTITQNGAAAQILTVRGEQGWKVDLVATAGTALASQLTELVTRLVDVGEGDAADAALRYRTAAIRSLRAALQLQPDDRSLQLEIDALEALPRPGS